MVGQVETVADSARQFVIGLFRSMESSQWWTAEQLRLYQFQRLSAFLAHAHRTVPYYRRLLDNAGVEPLSLTPESWRRIPIVTRLEVQALGESLRSEGVPKWHGTGPPTTSSGSTGVPLRVAKSALAHMVRHASIARFHAWHERDVGANLIAVRKSLDGSAAYPNGTISHQWPEAWILGTTGGSAVLDIVTPMELQLEWLQRQDPVYLGTYPTNLLRLAQISLERGIRLPSLRQAITFGAVLTPAIRAACRDAWGVEIADNYSAQESGEMALQCPRSEHYHVQSETVMVEILDAEGNDCRPGDTGRVVVTPFYNYATPLIRYEIGDYAEVGEPCPCGRGLPVLRRIRGRYRNLVTLPDGRQYWPIFDHHKFSRRAPVRQYQIIQHAPDRLEAKLVVDRPLTAAEEAGIRQVLVEDIGFPFQVEFSYPSAIAGTAVGKYEDFMSFVTPR